VFETITRGVLRKAHDDHLLQHADIEVLGNIEQMHMVERFQDYGFSSHPIKEKDAKKTSSGSEQKDKHPAELILGCINGVRNLPVVYRLDDRRHRLKNMVMGECGMYDDLAQRVQLKRDHIAIESPQPNKIISVVVKEKRGEEDDQQQQQGGQEKEFKGQDSQKNRTPLSRITQEKNKITSEVLDDNGKKTLTIVIQEQQTITLKIRNTDEKDVIKVKQDNKDNPSTITTEVLDADTGNDRTKITQDKDKIKFEIFDPNGNVVTSLVIDATGVTTNAPNVITNTDTMVYTVRTYSIFGSDIGCYGPSHGWYP